ncbi:MAG TPA: ABC transporter permease [Nitrosopumilaceae archaeon]|nr:ABC transporter permease [Nitrosopumilaceae archaeon]
MMNIKLRFKGTYLGFIWAVLEPLFMFIILYVVFASVRHVEQENFPIYLIVGIILFNLFSRGTTAGLTSLRDNNAILKSLNIRKEFFPVVTTCATSLFLLVQIGVLFGLMPFFGFVPSWTIILLPIVLFLFLALVLGFCYILSILFVYVRDINPLWAVGVYTLLFISPIFWYSDETNGILLEIQKVNPLGQVIEIAHKIVVSGQIPPLNEWLYTASFVFGILFFGFALFQKYEKKVAEKI